MHYLDRRVTRLEQDIEQIIKICKNGGDAVYHLNKMAIINIDSWMTWRTFRFLLKDTYIDDETNKKWFNTPSSISYGQLNAIWKFQSYKGLVDEFISKKFKAELSQSNIDTTIDDSSLSNNQEAKPTLKISIIDKINKRRNTIAHFSYEIAPESSSTDDIFFTLRGTPKEIEIYYNILHQIFSTIERFYFLKKIHEELLTISANREGKILSFLTTPYIITWKDDSSIRKNKLFEIKKTQHDDYIDTAGICLAYQLTEDADEKAPHFCIEFNTNKESGWGIRCHENHPLYLKFQNKEHDIDPSKYYPFWKNLTNLKNQAYLLWGSKQYYRDVSILLQQIEIKTIENLLAQSKNIWYNKSKRVQSVYKLCIHFWISLKRLLSLSYYKKKS